MYRPEADFIPWLLWDCFLWVSCLKPWNLCCKRQVPTRSLFRPCMVTYWGPEEKQGGGEDEMVGWLHRLSGHELEQKRMGKPGMLQSMGLQRVGHNWLAEQQQQWLQENRPWVQIISLQGYRVLAACAGQRSLGFFFFFSCLVLGVYFFVLLNCVHHTAPGQPHCCICSSWGENGILCLKHRGMCAMGSLIRKV